MAKILTEDEAAVWLELELACFHRQLDAPHRRDEIAQRRIKAADIPHRSADFGSTSTARLSRLTYQSRLRASACGTRRQHG